MSEKCYASNCERRATVGIRLWTAPRELFACPRHYRYPMMGYRADRLRIRSIR